MQRLVRRLASLAVALLLGVSLSAGGDTQSLRVIAEWEPAVGTLISWPLGIPSSLVVELADDDLLFVLVTGQSAENQARSTFQAWGIDPAHVEYIHTSVQSHWPRDWGPHQIFDTDGTWTIVDPIFEGYPWVPEECGPSNSPGGYVGDNAVNIDVAAHFGAPLHSLPAYLTGGNFLVDGQGAAFSTCAMVGENNQLWTESEFLDIAEEQLGIRDYHVLDSTEDFGIQHIDCWFKPLDEETLLVKRPPAWHEEHDRIEANLRYLAGVTSSTGRPYRVIRIDTPPYDGYNVAAYTNSLILNGKILVPLFGIDGDADAIATFQAAMPGYEVIGYPWAGWYYYDALHCRTRAVFDRQMLRIAHRRLATWLPATSPYEVTVWIDDRSEAGLLPDLLRVYWREAGTAEWSWEVLTATTEPDSYTAAIPEQAAGTTIDYYITAADASGRSETQPRTAPAGFYSFTAGCAPIQLAVGRSRLSWNLLAGATGYDVVRGDLGTLCESGGDLTPAVNGCVAENHERPTFPYTDEPLPGAGSWFLVRAKSAAGNSSYGFAGDCDRTPRDARIDVAPEACP